MKSTMEIQKPSDILNYLVPSSKISWDSELFKEFTDINNRIKLTDSLFRHLGLVAPSTPRTTASVVLCDFEYSQFLEDDIVTIQDSYAQSSSWFSAPKIFSGPYFRAILISAFEYVLGIPYIEILRKYGDRHLSKWPKEVLDRVNRRVEEIYVSQEYPCMFLQSSRDLAARLLRSSKSVLKSDKYAVQEITVDIEEGIKNKRYYYSDAKIISNLVFRTSKNKVVQYDYFFEHRGWNLFLTDDELLKAKKVFRESYIKLTNNKVEATKRLIGRLKSELVEAKKKLAKETEELEFSEKRSTAYLGL